MLATEDFYLRLLDEDKRTGYLFRVFELPKGKPIVFLMATLGMAALVQTQFSLYHLPLLPAVIICWETISIVNMRTEILEECILEEDFLATLLILEGGAHPELPGAPDTVVDEDRYDYFYGALGCKIKKPFWKREPSFYINMIILVGVYFAFCGILKALYEVLT